MSSKEEERNLARKKRIEMYGKRQKREKTKRDKYGNLLRDSLSKTFKPPMSRRALPGAEIGTEDDGYKAAQMQQAIDMYQKRRNTYSGRVIDPRKSTTDLVDGKTRPKKIGI